MAAVDVGECGVVGGFEAEFYDNGFYGSNGANRHYNRTNHI